jgi:uncharacterized RDD family membrane protein YckC
MLDRLARSFLGQFMECPFCQRQTSVYSKWCNSCGKAIPPGQYLLEESGVVQRAAMDTLGAAAIATRTQVRCRFARLGDRFIAFVLDTAFLFGLFAVVDAWAFTRWGWVEGSELRLTTASLLIAVTLNAIVLFLYGWLLEAAWGATLGKAMMGIRVVGTRQGRSFSACAVRNLLRIVDGLGFYLVGTVVAACSDARQRIGDIYARTAVIEESFRSVIRVAAMVLWIASLAAAAWAVPRICSVNRFARPLYLSQVIVRVGKSESLAYFQVGSFAVHIQIASTSSGS